MKCSLCERLVIHRHDAEGYEPPFWVFPSASEHGTLRQTKVFHQPRTGRIAWECDCPWGTREGVTTKCWHAQAAGVMEVYFDQVRGGKPDTMEPNDYTDHLLRYMRALCGDPDDQYIILSRAVTEAVLLDDPYMVKRARHMLGQWALVAHYHLPELEPPDPEGGSSAPLPYQGELTSEAIADSPPVGPLNDETAAASVECSKCNSSGYTQNYLTKRYYPCRHCLNGYYAMIEQQEEDAEAGRGEALYRQVA